MRCSNCGNELPNDALFCDNCGQKAEVHTQQKHYCGNCGAEIDEGIGFCGNCGSRVNTAPQSETNSVFCGSCGAEIDSKAEFCGNCGAAVGTAYSNNISKPAKKKNILPVIIVILIAVIALLSCLLGAYIYFSDSGDDSEIDKSVSISEQEKGHAADVNENNSGSNANDGGADTSVSVTAQPQTQAPPVFTYVTASSIRGTDTEGGQYSTEAVLDSDKMTKWVPSKNSNGGISEWIQINASEMQCINGIYILNGYHKSEEIWKNNNRVKECTLSFSDGQSKIVTLDDTMELIKIELDTPINTTYIKLTINSIYSGTKWDDTAITYLSAY